jgi:hypothetical protein
MSTQRQIKMQIKVSINVLINFGVLLKPVRVILIIFLFHSVSEAAEPSVNNLRQELFALNQNSGMAPDLLAKLEQIENPSSLIIAYKAVCEAHIAKVVSNPFEKYSYLQMANKHLSHAIDLDNYNIEIRFLRYAVQVQTPKILGFRRNVGEDKKIIMNSFTSFDWSKIDRKVIHYIYDFMMENSECGEYEKARLHYFLSKV